MCGMGGEGGGACRLHGKDQADGDIVGQAFVKLRIGWLWTGKIPMTSLWHNSPIGQVRGLLSGY